ncbi:MAG: YaiI/YqxD family protein [Candidatus Saccharibacteria bacterium]
MKILVDADACPKKVLHICFQLGARHGVEVWTVASFNHNIESNHHVVVGNDPQEADIKLINLSSGGDIAVTQDWGLAAMLLGKGVNCISPDGRQYRNEKIDFLLEEREVKAKMRRAGGRTKGPAKRSSEADERFASTLERILSGNHR